MNAALSLARGAVLAAGLLAASTAGAQLFKCVQPDGRVVYQDTKCDERAKESTLRGAPSAPPPARTEEPKAAGAAPAGAAPSSAGKVIELVAGYRVCAERVPNFEAKYAAAYEGWKSRNAAGFARTASEPDASLLDERLRSERERPEGAGLLEHCAGVATDLQPPRAAAN